MSSFLTIISYLFSFFVAVHNDIKPEDFELVDYEPEGPQLKFELAI